MNIIKIDHCDYCDNDDLLVIDLSMYSYEPANYCINCLRKIIEELEHAHLNREKYER